MRSPADIQPSSLTTPLAVDIPTLPPGELERLSVAYSRSRDPRLRDQLVFFHQRLVRSIASRFLGAGEAIEDLIQVGNIGLINALDRYDPDQGTRFSTYATPTILGEIKRYFRDKTAVIKVPRWLQEMNQSVRRTAHTLTQELGRSPTIPEIAARLGIDEEEVTQALECSEAVNPISLDSALEARGGSERMSLLDLLGRTDGALHDIERFGDLRTAIQALSEREREVISLRFFDELSQAKIARQLNISQMHVSRLQQRALNRLREIMSDEPRVKKPAKARRSASASRRTEAAGLGAHGSGEGG
jgi:RNA polymerase sigma-70 factor, sigma-B/F/G subfamily